MFGILKRNGKVYTVTVEGTKTKPYPPTIKRKTIPDSLVYKDSYRSCEVLDISEFGHWRINHSNLFANRQNHINGIGNFPNQAKRILRKYNGNDLWSIPLFS